MQKFNNDNFYGNYTLAHIGGVQLDDLNNMEEQFLDILDFDVFVQEEEYNQYKVGLENFF